jgi:hypothetical protein
MKSETVTPLADVQSLIVGLFADVKRKLPTEYLAEDVEYIFSRLEKEGMSFLFSTLPKLGKAVETALISEEPLLVPPDFGLVKGTRLPKFMYQYFSMVFDDKGDIQLAERGVDAVEILRQITLCFSKVVVSSENKSGEALEAFQERVSNCGIRRYHHIFKYARKYIRLVFTDDGSPTMRALRDFERNPWGKHGPGAVAGGERGLEKWLFNQIPGINDRMYRIQDDLILPVCPEPGIDAARALCVPKDFRGPRVICAEPKEFQFGQQGLKEILYEHLNNHYLTRKHIDFDDVSRNRAACFNTELATIDLKDASDNLSLELARLLMPRHLFRLLTRYRSRGVKVNGTIIRPRTFATMGSALCFPIQTLIFLSICKGVQWFVNRVKTREKSPVFVFGDDIIVSRSIAPLVMEVLEAAGLVVNTAKTAIHELVKESCGEWVIAGRSQVIVKPKTITVNGISSVYAVYDTAAQFYEKDWVATSVAMGELLRGFCSTVKRRYNRNLQRFEWRFPAPVEAGKHPKHAGLCEYYHRLSHPTYVDPLVGPASQTTVPLHGTFVKVKRKWVGWDPRDRAFMPVP